MKTSRLRLYLPAWTARALRCSWTGIRGVAQFLLITWGTFAIFYSNLPWAWMRDVLAFVFALFSVWALWIGRHQKLQRSFAIAFGVVAVWWISIRPSHDRHWRPEVSVMPRITIDGDRVRITGFRNFEYYRTREDFRPRYEEREFLISHLTSVDFFVSYFLKRGPVAHTFLSFSFDNALPLCISIETRPEVGEGFSPIASLFKQFELIYVVGDERDIVGVRTNYRKEDVYLYRIRTSPENARRLLLVYIDRINQLADHAEFYHLLSNNCTINIIRYARKAGRVGRFDIRHILNGFIDSYIYSAGLVDNTLPFDELRRRSRINDAAETADDAPDFSQRIRASLPFPGH